MYEWVQSMISRARTESKQVVGGGRIGDQEYLLETTMFLNPKSKSDANSTKR